MFVVQERRNQKRHADQHVPPPFETSQSARAVVSDLVREGHGPSEREARREEGDEADGRCLRRREAGEGRMTRDERAAQIGVVDRGVRRAQVAHGPVDVANPLRSLRVDVVSRCKRVHADESEAGARRRRSDGVGRSTHGVGGRSALGGRRHAAVRQTFPEQALPKGGQAAAIGMLLRRPTFADGGRATRDLFLRESEAMRGLANGDDHGSVPLPETVGPASAAGSAAVKLRVSNSPGPVRQTRCRKPARSIAWRRMASFPEIDRIRVRRVAYFTTSCGRPAGWCRKGQAVSRSLVRGRF